MKLIATLGDISLYQTGYTTFYPDYEALTETFPAGHIMDAEGNVIPVPNILSVLATQDWVLVADPDEPLGKGRKRQFASRAEAGRYAARIRWGNRGPDANGPSSVPSNPLPVAATNDINEAILTGAPYAPFLPENFPPELKAALDEIPKSDTVGSRGPASDKAQEMLSDYYLSHMDPASYSPETLAALGKGSAHYTTLSADGNIWGRRAQADGMADVMVKRVHEQMYVEKFIGAPEALAYTRGMVASPNKRVAVAVHADNLMSVLEGGFTTQFETGKSGGSYVPTYRAAYEAVTFGVHPATIPSRRPIYANLHPVGVQSTRTNRSDQYGEVQLVVKQSVHARTTFTVQDSLGSNRTPASVNGPIKVGQASPTARKDMRRQSEHPADKPTKSANGESYSYAEAQIQQGLKVSDIAYVTIPKGKRLPAGAAARLKALGIPVKRTNGSEILDDASVAKSVDATIFLIMEAVEKAKKGKGKKDKKGKGKKDKKDGKGKSFGGDRSEAGRYAARIRWGDRGPEALSPRLEAIAAQSEAAYVPMQEGNLQEQTLTSLVESGFEGNGPPPTLEPLPDVPETKPWDGYPPKVKDAMIAAGITTDEQWLGEGVSPKDKLLSKLKIETEGFYGPRPDDDEYGTSYKQTFNRGTPNEFTRTVYTPTREQFAAHDKWSEALDKRNAVRKSNQEKLDAWIYPAGASEKEKQKIDGKIAERLGAHHGFHRPAQTVGADDFDSLAKSGRFVVVWRGGTEQQISSLSTTRPHIGGGEGGLGTYTAFSSFRASEYGELTPMLIPKVALGRGRMSYGAWGLRQSDPSGYLERASVSHSRSERKFTADLLVHNTSILIVGPRRHDPSKLLGDLGAYEKSVEDLLGVGPMKWDVD